jgi:hypothetical protein
MSIDAIYGTNTISNTLPNFVGKVLVKDTSSSGPIDTSAASNTE